MISFLLTLSLTTVYKLSIIISAVCVTLIYIISLIRQHISVKSNTLDITKLIIEDDKYEIYIKDESNEISYYTLTQDEYNDIKERIRYVNS